MLKSYMFLLISEIFLDRSHQQGYFFALQRRRKSFAEIFRSGDNLEETTGSNPPAAVEVEEEEEK